jgi:hypothetical protein
MSFYFYDQLPDEWLYRFQKEIQLNRDNGVMVKPMEQELRLIQIVIEKRQ